MDTGQTLHSARLHARVTGIVQGVGYRAFARHHARALGVTGYARNLADGSVEVIAEGPRSALERLIPYLRRGAPAGHVDALTVGWEQATGEFDRFSTR